MLSLINFLDHDKGVIFEDGTIFQRVDDDECQVQNNVAACTNSIIHDALICANGDGISVCNVNAEVSIKVDTALAEKLSESEASKYY